MLTALLLVSLFSAPGDAIYVARSGKVVEGKLVAASSVILDAGQKLELSSALASTFPGIPPASMDEYYCFSNPPAVADRMAVDLQALAAATPWLCRASNGDPQASDEAALDYELATDGLCKLHDRADGTSFLLCERAEMSLDARILNDAFTESVFDRTLNLVWEFRCRRNPELAGEISCAYNAVKIASPVVWRADRKAGMLVLTIGKVAPQ